MKLQGAWRRDYSEFFDTQEALLIDAMDNADSIYTVFARLQSLAVKCGAPGSSFSTKAFPTPTRCLLRSPRRPFPPFGNACSRSCSSALSSARMASTPSRTGSLTRTSRQSTRCARETVCARLRSVPVRTEREPVR